MPRAKLREVHALLERRGFLAMLAARSMPGGRATGLHYVAGVAPVGVPS
jgi:membrane protein DedA with SNARE-associated domain